MQKPDDLKVYELSHALTLAVYEATSRFPADENYGLTRQMRKAASSVPANLAEGRGRSGDRELRRFVDIAHGSLVELEYQLRLAGDLGYLDEGARERLLGDAGRVGRMLQAFRSRLLDP